MKCMCLNVNVTASFETRDWAAFLNVAASASPAAVSRKSHHLAPFLASHSAAFGGSREWTESAASLASRRLGAGPASLVDAASWAARPAATGRAAAPPAPHLTHTNFNVATKPNRTAFQILDFV